VWPVSKVIARAGHLLQLWRQKWSKTRVAVLGLGSSFHDRALPAFRHLFEYCLLCLRGASRSLSSQFF
jgi:hypothetical protein